MIYCLYGPLGRLEFSDMQKKQFTGCPRCQQEDICLSWVEGRGMVFQKHCHQGVECTNSGNTPPRYPYGKLSHPGMWVPMSGVFYSSLPGADLEEYAKPTEHLLSQRKIAENSMFRARR